MEDYVETILDYLKEAKDHNYIRSIIKYDLSNILARFAADLDKDYDKGYDDGFNAGKEESYDDGYDDGYADAKYEESNN